MIVCLSFPNGLTSTRNDSIRYNPKHPLFIEKISKTRIEFPCVPHIAMSVDFNSFREFYDLTDEEDLIWSDVFGSRHDRSSNIVSIVICNGYLKVMLDRI